MRTPSIALASLSTLALFSMSCQTPSGRPPACPKMSDAARAELTELCGGDLDRCRAVRDYLVELVRHCRVIEVMR